MDDLTLALRREGARFQPAEGAFADVIRRGTRRQRSRRLASAAVALGLFALVDLGLLRGLVSHRGQDVPAGREQSGPIAQPQENTHDLWKYLPSGAGTGSGSISVRFGPGGEVLVVNGGPPPEGKKPPDTSGGHSSQAPAGRAGAPAGQTGRDQGGRDSGGTKMPEKSSGNDGRHHHKKHHDGCTSTSAAGPASPGVLHACVPAFGWGLIKAVPPGSPAPSVREAPETAVVDPGVAIGGQTTTIDGETSPATDATDLSAGSDTPADPATAPPPADGTDASL